MAAPKDLLVPFDGSPAALAALRTALSLAHGSRSVLTGLFVVDEKVIDAHFFEDLAGSAGIGPFLALEQQSRKALTQIGRYQLNSLQKACAAKGIRCRTLLREGGVVDRILAESRQADLVVMGNRSRRGNGGLIGTTVERVVRHSPSPILVVQAGMRPVRRILTGFDASGHARKTLALALDAAGWFRASLTVLHVASDAAEGKRALERARKLAGGKGRGVRFESRTGDPASTLARLAHRRETDLLVLGAYGHGYLREFLLGSTTDLVLRETRTPLLIQR